MHFICMCGIYNVRRNDFIIACLIKYFMYIVFAGCIGIAAYLYRIVVTLLSFVMIFGLLEYPGVENPLLASIFVVIVFPSLFGLIAYGCYYILIIFFKSFTIHLSVKFGVAISSIAALYLVLCFLPFIFPQLHIPFSLF